VSVLISSRIPTGPAISLENFARTADLPVTPTVRN
jgi:hypothetical protein